MRRFENATFLSSNPRIIESTPVGRSTKRDGVDFVRFYASADHA